VKIAVVGNNHCVIEQGSVKIEVQVSFIGGKDALLLTFPPGALRIAPEDNYLIIGVARED
jgi:hypothetical protein